MGSSRIWFAYTGVVPAVCDAEAGDTDRLATDVSLGELATDFGFTEQPQLMRLFRKSAASANYERMGHPPPGA